MAKAHWFASGRLFTNSLYLANGTLILRHAGHHCVVLHTFALLYPKIIAVRRDLQRAQGLALWRELETTFLADSYIRTERTNKSDQPRSSELLVGASYIPAFLRYADRYDDTEARRAYL